MSNFWAIGFISGYCVGRLYLKEWKRPKKKKYKTIITQIGNHLFTIQTFNMQLKKSQFPVKGHVAPTDDQGGAEGIENLSFSSSDGNVLSVSPDPDREDGMGFIVEAVGLGKASILATADAELGDGEAILHDALEIEVIADEATKLNITLDLPEVNTDGNTGTETPPDPNTGSGE